ncbi:TPA: restriction endonuclease subunit S [Salmonella enterica subsp. salamae]|nr:restriction endonuclease subunit S [Salmonella enterica subsp. salamae]
MSGGKLPEGWVETPLENIVEILDSMRIPVNNKERQKRIEGKDFNKLYPYYGATGEVGKIDDFIFDEELIALGEDGVPFFDGQKNKAYMLYGKTWVNNHAHVLRAIQGLSHNKFLCYFLNQFDYHDYVNGGTRLKLTQANMRKIPVRFAPFSEQKIIDEKLDTLLAQVDTTKARLEQIPQILKRFRQAVLNSSIALNSQESKIKLAELTSKIGSGSTPKGGNNNYKSDGIPFVRSLNIHTHFIKYEDLAYIDNEQANKLNNAVIREKDVLLNITGASIGRVNIAPDIFVGGRVNQHVAIIRCQQSKILPEYLHVYMASPKVQKWIQGENYGATRQALTKKMLEGLLIIVPPLPEQHEIVRRVEQLFAYADAIEKQVNNALTRVNNLTQSILAKAFRGELTAQWRAENPDLISGENSAAALLEKIKAERAASGGKKTSRKKA